MMRFTYDDDDDDDDDDSLLRCDIFHKHHKQRLCKSISTWVKFFFGTVLVYVSF